ncbi:MAG: hypothetical protein L3J98_14025 [Gammaproteobacteria bacterium]|nr:hypothetical protein [Gammaproteobacteria bacterium]
MSTQNSGKNRLTEMRDLIRRLYYSIHTERVYCDWVARLGLTDKLLSYSLQFPHTLKG